MDNQNIDQTLQLMGDFFLTADVGSAAKLATKQMLIKTAKSEGKKQINKIAASNIIQKLTPLLAQSATMSLLMPQMYQTAEAKKRLFYPQKQHFCLQNRPKFNHLTKKLSTI